MFKLYELTEMYRNVWDLVGDEEADLDSLENALQGIEDNINSKAENTAKLIKNIDGDIKTLREEERRLQARRRALENKQKNIKEYLEIQLKNMGVDKVKTPLFTVAIQNNPQSVDIVDENLIPEDFIQYKKSISRRDILKALKEGKEIPGATIKQTRSLRIR